jgi:hypothetical protein
LTYRELAARKVDILLAAGNEPALRAAKPQKISTLPPITELRAGVLAGFHPSTLVVLRVSVRWCCPVNVTPALQPVNVPTCHDDPREGARGRRS